jgi:hypothetical protein
VIGTEIDNKPKAAANVKSAYFFIVAYPLYVAK